MNGFGSAISQFLRDLRAQKLRTFLTIFGIIWGTVAIVVLLGFGMGFKRQLMINFHGIGESIAIMWPGKTTMAFEGFGTGRFIPLIEEDAALLGSQVREIKNVCAEYSAEGRISVGVNIINTSVGGVFPVYADMRNLIPEEGGRFINDPDVQDRRRVVFIGDEVRRLLFGEGEAVGHIVFVDEVPFTVIGVMQKKTQSSSYNRMDRDRIYIPATTFRSVMGVDHIQNIIFNSYDRSRSEETIARVREVLGRKYRFDPEDKDAVSIWDTAEFDRFGFYFFLAFNIFMGLIGSFTLGVGGIGVANIMFIVVQERVKEIGIRRAVGATRGSITVQFFSETFFIIALGSIIGFAIAYGIIRALTYIPIAEYVGTPELSIEVLVATVAVLGIVGFTAGLLPARKAASLNVVDCLRA